jgi:hypothetical protein
MVFWRPGLQRDIAEHRKIPRNDDFGGNFREIAEIGVTGLRERQKMAIT